MPKNVILLHLESVSNTIFWQYRSEFATLWRLWQDSLRFTRFHSNATSTKMACECCLLGSTAQNDYCSYYSDRITRPNCGFKHLSSFLVALGYDWRTYLLDYYLRVERLEPRYHSHNNPVKMLSCIREHMAKAARDGKPFGMYVNNQVSHMALDDHAKAGAQTFSDRFSRGYKSLDASVNQLLTILAELQLWDNTLIIGFGDHGDEMWSHGLNRGYCHGTPPYASLTWTPLFIHNSGLPSGDNAQLVDMTDIKETTLRLLFPEFSTPAGFPEINAAPFSGIDIFSRKKEFVFSQNLYALQLEHKDPEAGMYKGYSVTDGTYRLLVSSGGNKPKEGGMEFFCDRLDPTNSRNLLDFFVLGVDGRILHPNFPSEANAPGFAIIFNPIAIEHMVSVFHAMLDALKEHVRAKERLALQYAAGRPTHTMPEKAFTVARRRRRVD